MSESGTVIQPAQTDGMRIVVDGAEVPARPGELIIEALQRSGTYVPRFCYHPRMRPVGMCRMCLVEVKGPRGFSLQPACFLPVANGLEVITNSTKVQRAQAGVLELLLINHPLDCPVCDKGGECPLQDQAMGHGAGESRFVEEKRHFAKPVPIGPLVLLDRERCIQCGRCTRFAEEVAGEPEIDFLGRGDHIEVGVFPTRPFRSHFAGNTVQICPVGALTARPYRFKSRPWDMEQVESTCTVCPVGCRMVVQSAEGSVVRHLGVDSEAVNHSWLCDKGRFGFEVLHSPGRLRVPELGRGPARRQATWAEAVREAADRLIETVKLHGRDAVGFIGGSDLTNEDAYAMARLAKGILGTASVDCRVGADLGVELLVGLPRATIAEAVSASTLVSIGADLKEVAPVLYLRLRAALRASQPPRLVEFSYQRTGLSELAAERHQVSPGTLGLEILSWLDSLESITAGDSSAGDGEVVIVSRPSVAESASSLDQALLQVARRRPGTRFIVVPTGGNTVGALDAGLAPQGYLPGGVRLTDGQDHLADTFPQLSDGPGRDCGAILKAAAEGQLQALVVLGDDVLSVFPDRRLAEKALDSVGLLVTVGGLANSTTERADVVLPALIGSEREGTVTNFEGRVSRLGRKVAGVGLARPAWLIASELARRLGQDFRCRSVDDVTAQLASACHRYQEVRSPGGIPPEGTLVPAERNGQPASVQPIDPMATPGIAAVEQQGSPSRSAVRIRPRPVTTGRPLPTASPLPDPGTVEGPPALAAYSIRLVVEPRLMSADGVGSNCPSLAGLISPLGLRLSPVELDRLGVKEGGLVRLVSPRGRLELSAHADDDLSAGVGVIPYLAGGNSCDVLRMIDAFEPVTDVRLESL
jgi:NADH-quinone oxidoreductase subunit G